MICCCVGDGRPVTGHPQILYIGLYAMSTIHCELTTRCNLSCPYCYVSPRLGSELNAEEWIRLLRLLGHLDEMTYVITGGEPLLRVDLIDILSAASSAGICHLYTNATVSEAEFLRVLEHVDMVRISLDGASPKDYQRVRGGDYFSNVVANIRHLVRNDIPHSVQMTVSEANVDCMKQTVSLLESLGVERILLSPQLKVRASHGELLAMEELSKRIQMVFSLSSRIVQKLAIEPSGCVSKFYPGAACGVYQERFLITSDGWLAGCPLLAASSNCIQYLVGETFEGVRSAVKNARLSVAQQSAVSACTTCTELTKCGGWCPGVRGGVTEACPRFRPTN